MRTMSLIPVVLALTAAAPDPGSRDRLLAEAAAMTPAALAFERTITASATGEAPSTRVDRWDGKAWTLLRVDGKPPSPDDVERARKAGAAVPVPGYYRLAKLLAGATATTDAAGRTVLRTDHLPAGSVMANGRDIADHFAAEATVAAGPRPYIAQVRLTARAPFRMMLVAKVETFVTVSDYRLGATGVPELARQTSDVNGSMMGKSGIQHSEVTFAYR